MSRWLGREYELMEGVFGARMRIVRSALGDESIELTEYLAPKGRPIPADMRANDRVFQHIAIIVSDMDQAYARLRQFRLQHASTGPQTPARLEPKARRHQRLLLPRSRWALPRGAAFPRRQGARQVAPDRSRCFSASITPPSSSDDTDRSLKLYRDTLGMKVAGESENYDIEQEHLNNVFGARLRITALRAAEGPGIELLEYLAPRDGRPAPIDLQGQRHRPLADDAPDDGTRETAGPPGAPAVWACVTSGCHPSSERPGASKRPADQGSRRTWCQGRGKVTFNK